MQRNSIWILSASAVLIVVGTALYTHSPRTGLGITFPASAMSSHDNDTIEIEQGEGEDSTAPRPSRRYENDEIRRKERGSIERMIIAQEMLVADRKKEISALVRTRGIVFSPEEDKDSKADASFPQEGDDFVKAKMALDKEVQILERLNNKLARIRD